MLKDYYLEELPSVHRDRWNNYNCIYCGNSPRYIIRSKRNDGWVIKNGVVLSYSKLLLCKDSKCIEYWKLKEC